MHSGEAHLSPPCLAPNHERGKVVFVLITMFVLPVVNCAGSVSASENKTDHLALLAIKSAIKDPLGALTSWNHSRDHCHWEGIICGHQHRRVVALNLSSVGLAGTISPYIGNLSFLRSIDLSTNKLGGQIPAEIGFLSRLSFLYLFQNLLIGEIPSSISNCLSLKCLSIGENSLVGRIPPEFSSLSMLRELYVHKNNFSGPIFSTIQNLTSLEELSAENNAFEGIIPDTIGHMKNLSYLAIGSNQLTGMIPLSIYNLSSLTVVSLYYNHLHGSLPTNIASTLPHLQVLELDGNNFTGPLPVSLSNISSLTEIGLSMNKFTGKVPWNLGHLKHLQLLRIGNNSLGSGDANDLSFLSSLVNCTNLEILGLGANYFGGVLPHTIANLSAKLIALELHFNMISGRIPAGISHLTSLVRLVSHKNQLSGTIPSEIGKLQKLEIIDLGLNMFSGVIPESLGNLSKLSWLSLEENYFQGYIPSSLGDCQNLINMYVHQNNLSGTIPKGLFKGSPHLVELTLGANHLDGPLPIEVSHQINLVRLVVANNKLSGEIPSVIGSCSSLVFLYFHGHIGASLSSLKSLQELDLSHNNFSGPIPTYLSKFPLVYLNLSYNYFEGEVPVWGVFGNRSAISLIANPKLCGGILELHLPRCTGKEVTKAKISFQLNLIISCACALIAVAIVFSVYCIYCRKKWHSSLQISSFREPSFKVSYKMLLKATEGFFSSNLLSVGTYGSVFKGALEHNQMTVAVKVLNLQQPGASKNFMAECKALRNLVRVITACSSADYQEISAFFKEWILLLTWLLRLNISTMNVLLDNNMVAHIGNFGLAKFLPRPFLPNQSSSTGVQGIIGYTAPEYGLRGDPSAASDIYSYGIVVLEMMTGKRPTNNMFKDGLNLHTYVEKALPDQFVQIVDAKLLDNEGYILNNVRTSRQAAIWLNCVLTMMKIGVACSMESPQERISLKDATAELLKDATDWSCMFTWALISDRFSLEFGKFNIVEYELLMRLDRCDKSGYC